MDNFGALNLRSIFAFFKGTDNLGVGTRDLGFRRSQTIPVNSTFLGPQWNVKRSFNAITPAYTKMSQEVVPVSIRGSGLGFGGQFTSAQLVDFERPGN